MGLTYVMSRVRTRTHGSVGRRRLRPPLTRSLTALADAAIALSALRAFIFRGDTTTGVNSANLNASNSSIAYFKVLR
jgi:hypothetical protein